MISSELSDITIATAKEKTVCTSVIGNDLVMFDKFELVPLPTAPKRMRCLLVALCLEGQAQYTVDTNEYKVKGGDLIVISEGQVVGNYMLSPDCRGVACLASDNFFHEIIKEVHELSQLFLLIHSNPVFNLNEEVKERFCEYFNQIKAKVDDERHRFRRELVLSMFKTLMYDLGNELWQLIQVEDKKNTRGEIIFTNFIGLLEQNFRTERRVKWYADNLCITPKYLSETIKNVSKRTPNDWIDSYVTNELRILLRNSTKSIKEIAIELNFPTQSFLGKYFKEHTGQSPSQYRKK